jgi:hypothetical protein
MNSFVESRASLSGVSSGSAYRAGESSWDITGLNLIYCSPLAHGWLYTFPFVTSACTSRRAAPNDPSKGRAQRLRPARPTQISESLSCYELQGRWAGARRGVLRRLRAFRDSIGEF